MIVTTSRLLPRIVVLLAREPVATDVFSWEVLAELVHPLEVEEPLSREEYLRLLQEADPTRFPIQKTRYCLTWDNQCFEIDVYPFWQDRAIMEIELRSEDDEIRFPPEIEIIREVTSDRNYRNSSLAKTGGIF